MLGVPEQIFIEFSERCGKNSETELFPPNYGRARTLRKLTSLNPLGGPPEGEKVTGTLLLERTEYPGDGDAYATLKYFTFFGESTDEMIDSILELRTSRERPPGESDNWWSLNTSAQFRFSRGFDFIRCGAHWPLVSAMLNRFAELTSGFPGEIRMREGRILSKFEE